MRVRDAHFFRKLPRDVSEGTWQGGLLSLLALATIGWLVHSELSEWISLRRSVRMELDSTAMPSPLGPSSLESIRLNFNISLHRVPCAYASVQVADRLGSHKLEGVRNVHKVRIDREGRSLGMWSPHKYGELEAGAHEGDMAEHVFPWHKQMHTQGSAEHRAAAQLSGLSEQQKAVIGGVNEAMRLSSGAKPVAPATAPTQPGKRIPLFANPGSRQPLFGELATTAAVAAMAQGPSGSATPSAPLPELPSDSSPECATWATSGECAHNPAFMLLSCAKSCLPHAKAPDCVTWVSGGFCSRAAAFMAHACPGKCAGPESAPAPGPSPTPAVGVTAEAAGGADASGGEAKAVADEPETQQKPPEVTAAGGKAAAPEAGAVTEATNDTAEGAESETAAIDQLADLTREETAGSESAKEVKQGWGGSFASKDGVVGSGVAGYVPDKAFEDVPFTGDEEAFNTLIKEKAAVMVNFYAPWCFWSNKLLPAWKAISERLHSKSYSKSVSIIKVDCTSEPSKTLCRKQAIHAFPSIHIYRGTTHAFEPYEFGRDENVLWLHLVKVAAEAVVARLNELTAEERKPFSVQITDISKDLKTAMERRKAGLDEDWTDDALTPEEEVAEDKELLSQIDDAAASILAAKGVPLHLIHSQRQHGADAEARAVRIASSDVVLGLLADGANAGSGGAGGGTQTADGEPLDLWTETEAHEGCMIFGYVDVSRAPGTLHIAPHSARHSFDFSRVNVSHHIDHLSFGLELGSLQRRQLPEDVVAHLRTLDGRDFLTKEEHVTMEHHVNIVPTKHSFSSDRFVPIETYQFTATSHSRTKDTLPSVLISYDVSPIQVHIQNTRRPISELLLSLCAIIGGAFAMFGIIDGILYAGSNVVRQKVAAGKLH